LNRCTIGKERTPGANAGLAQGANLRARIRATLTTFSTPTDIVLATAVVVPIFNDNSTLITRETRETQTSQTPVQGDFAASGANVDIPMTVISSLSCSFLTDHLVC